MPFETSWPVKCYAKRINHDSWLPDHAVHRYDFNPVNCPQPANQRKGRPMKKTTAAKLYDRMQKIAKWTVLAEDALTREEAQKALRKVAKHQWKLAYLQAKAYTEIKQGTDQ